MVQEQSTVADIFRRAQAVQGQRPDAPYKEIKELLLKEFSGKPFPSLHNLTIPEQDDKAPEEDWTAGLPIVRRGIQFQDWKEIIDGIVLSLEQVNNYVRERGAEGDHDKWHDRAAGIEGPTNKAVSKWLPEDLMKLAEKSAKR